MRSWVGTSAHPCWALIKCLMPATLRTPYSVEWVQFFHMGGLHFWNRRTRETTRQPQAGVTVVWVGMMDEAGLLLLHWHKETRVSTSVLPPLLG